MFEEYAPALKKRRHKKWNDCRTWWSAKWRGIRIHFSDFWNILDIGGYLMMIIGFGLRFGGCEEGTRVCFSIALFIMYMRLLQALLIKRSIGTTIIMLKEAVKVLLGFLIVLGVFIVGTGVFYHANLYPNHKHFLAHHWGIWKIIYLPFWAIFGEFKEELDGIGESNCSFNETIYNNNPSIMRCPETRFVVAVMSGLYTVMSNLVLVNLIIAMFSFRFEKIMENSENYWRYQKSTVIMQFKSRQPVPLNMFHWMYMLFKCCIKATTGDKEVLRKQRIIADRWENREVDRLQW